MVASPSFAAIIFHADTPAMLRRCMEHHLTIGVDRLFVSLNVDDTESAALAGSYDSDRVRVARRCDYAPDPFDYFTPAYRFAAEWAKPDWLMFVDSDEFWVPAGGTMRDIEGLQRSDICRVRRFNAIPIRRTDGTIEPFDGAPATTLVVGARQAMDGSFLAEHPRTAWINAKIGPKLMVRPGAVAHISFGAHDVAPAHARVVVTVPDDVVIVHVPFSDEARFRRKVELAGAMLERIRHRLQPAEAWHWRRWQEISASGGLGDEFAAQVVDAPAVDGLIAGGVLTTAADLLAQRSFGD